MSTPPGPGASSPSPANGWKRDCAVCKGSRGVPVAAMWRSSMPIFISDNCLWFFKGESASLRREVSEGLSEVWSVLSQARELPPSCHS